MTRKIATESAEAFAEAVSNDEDNPTPAQGVPERLQRSPVSWSDSQSVEMADELAQMGVDSGLPESKIASVIKEAETRTSPYAALIKEALVMSTGARAARFGARAGWDATKGALKGTRKATQMASKGAVKATKGVNNAGKGIRDFRRSRGHDLSISPGRATARLAPETAFHANHYRNM